MGIKFFSRFLAFALLASMFAVAGGPYQPQEVTAALIKSITRDYFEGQTKVITVVTGKRFEKHNTRIAEELEKAGFRVEVIPADDVDKAAGDILFLGRGLNRTTLDKARMLNRFSFSNSIFHVEKGYASIGLLTTMRTPYLVANAENMGLSGLNLDNELYQHLDIVDTVYH